METLKIRTTFHYDRLTRTKHICSNGTAYYSSNTYMSLLLFPKAICINKAKQGLVTSLT